MKLFNFILSFIQNKLGKRDLRDRIRVIIQKFEDVVIPAYNEVGMNPALIKPVSKYGIDYMASFSKRLPSSMRVRSSTPYWSICNQSFTNAVKLLQMLDDDIGDKMPDTIHIDGITYQKATILRLIELMDFMADYASRQLCYYVASETNLQAFEIPDKAPFSKSEETAIVSNKDTFFKTLEMFYNDPKKIMESINKIPEVLISGNETNDLPAASVTSVDPLRLGIIPGVSSLFQFVGETLVDWEFQRFERAKKEKKDIEYRVEIMKQRQATGQSDARAESILANWERELTLLRDKINKMEIRARG